MDVQQISIAAKVGSSSSEMLSAREDDDGIEATPHLVETSSAIIFRYPESINHGEEESDVSDVESGLPARRKNWSCHKCMKGNRFIPKEICIVCGTKYCYNCVVRAMGSMPEGRKCISCIGQRINEARRRNLGKSPRVLKQLFSSMEVKRIMLAEKSCKANQVPPDLVNVNYEPLSQQELFLLQTCQYPPKKLRPGYYWCDKVAGFWGKKGQKPCQIISPDLNIGGRISTEASNGNTNVMINNREITRPELLMLQLLGMKFKGATRFWLSADGSFREEGINYVKGNIWEKNMANLICIALSLPTPPGFSARSDKQANIDVLQNPSQRSFFKVLLFGSGKSGSSTIFKHAKIIYNNPFSEEDRQEFKFKIQRKLYGYLGILVKGCEQFEEESLIRKKIHLARHCSSSDNAGEIDSESMYSISPKLKPFSDWLLKTMVPANLETIFPAANRENGALVEELWNDAAIQATYSRRDELEMLPAVATYFLQRAVEVSKKEYEPSDTDILYAEEITSSNGPSSMEFSFPSRPQPYEYNGHDPSHRYQLIRVNPEVLGRNCKWLEMFGDVDLVSFCVSLIDYDEYVEDSNGVRVNKMMTCKQLFERVITHPNFEQKNFLLILTKFDLLEEKIEQFPLNRCEWFHDFDPVMGNNSSPCNSSSEIYTNTPLAHRAFQYIAVKFKRLFYSPKTKRLLFVSLVKALDPENVDEALRYAREILHCEETGELTQIYSSTSSSDESSSAKPLIQKI